MNCQNKKTKTFPKNLENWSVTSPAVKFSWYFVNRVFFPAAMYGVFFHDNQEPAFSNYRLWESLGFVIAFAYANFLCIKVKLIILLVTLIIGLVGYFLAEYINQMQVDRKYSVAEGMVLKEGSTK